MSSLVIDLASGEPPLPGVMFPADEAHDSGVVLVFAHGAGAGQASPFMRHYATLIAARGVTVVTFDFPYMAARRKLPDRPPALERAFLAAMTAAVAQRPHARALCVGGKSMGGRMATHLAAEPERWTGAVPFAGAVAFGYPLRPPGRRGGDRVSHLRRLGIATLIVQGTRDTFGGPDDVRAEVGAVANLEILPVATGDHSLKVLKAAGVAQADVDHDIVTQVVAWLQRRGARLAH